jgi:hypothetical protein
MEEDYLSETDAAGLQSGDIHIPASHWGSFLESFVRKHKGVPVRVWTEGPIEEAPGTCELLDARVWTDQVSITLVCDFEGPKHYIVANPRNILFKRDITGVAQGIDISALDGSVTHLRFRTDVGKETLEDVLAA